MRSDEEIREEAERLKELKPHVRQKTAFGDDNHEAIDAQVKVLEAKMDSDEIFEEWPEDAEDLHVRDSAQDAERWMNEESDEAPSEAWADLDQRKGSGA